MAESLVYVTCSSLEEAENIGTVLVERRVVACVNIIDGMRSLYWWEGVVEKGSETILLAKTRSDLVDELTEAVKAVHSYDVPCVVAIPIQGGNSDFLDWIRKETK